MAKQIGEIKITGTVAGITFYKMEGQYYARMKSSLEGARVKKDPRFNRTMESARRLARGSQVASKVYRALPKEERVYALYKELKGVAIGMLKEGRSEEETVQGLGVYLAATGEANRTAPVKRRATRRREAIRGALYAARRGRIRTTAVPAADASLWVNDRGRLVSTDEQAGDPGRVVRNGPPWIVSVIKGRGEGGCREPTAKG